MMNRISRRSSVALLASAPLAAVMSAKAFQQPAPPLRISSREAIRRRYFPNLPLVTHEGREVSFYDDLIKDKIVLLNFMYAACEGICPAATMNLGKVQRALGDRVGRDIFFYSITLKPAQDTPAVLKQYAEMHGAEPGWLFLTGAPDDVELLRRKLGFVDPDPLVDRDVSQHIGNVRYGNEARQLWGSCPAVVHPRRIVEALQAVDWPQGRRITSGGRP